MFGAQSAGMCCCGRMIAAAKSGSTVVELGKQKMRVLCYTPSDPLAVSAQAPVFVCQAGWGGAPVSISVSICQAVRRGALHLEDGGIDAPHILYVASDCSIPEGLL